MKTRLRQGHQQGKPSSVGKVWGGFTSPVSVCSLCGRCVVSASIPAFRKSAWISFSGTTHHPLIHAFCSWHRVDKWLQAWPVRVLTLGQIGVNPESFVNSKQRACFVFCWMQCCEITRNEAAFLPQWRQEKGLAGKWCQRLGWSWKKGSEEAQTSWEPRIHLRI